MRIFYLLFIGLILLNKSYAQTGALNTSDLVKLPLEDLLNIKVISSSKYLESLDSTAIGVQIIQQQEIINSGATSVIEALRLCSGLLVRETTPGNYDVHIRGMDNLLPARNQIPFVSNAITLVMINNRPVYNYFQGGTFWENLPVNLADVQRIEIIKGANSVLYGANAVAGVINFITQDLDLLHQDEKNTTIIQSTTDDNFNASVRINKKLGESAYFGASIGFQHRNRWDRYWNFRKSNYQDKDSLSFLTSTVSTNDRYPEPSKALRSSYFNFNYNQNINKDLNSSFSAGIAHSFAQKIYIYNQVTPITSNKNEDHYIHERLNYKNFNANIAYNFGENSIPGLAGWSYNYNVIDAILHYKFKFNNLLLYPEVGYRNVQYDDQMSVEMFGKDRAFLGRPVALETFSASIRLDYVYNGFRFVFAPRLDKYNNPNEPYINYQAILKYAISKSHVIRISNATANQGSFILESYFDQTQTFGFPGFQFTSVQKGNSNLNLLRVNTTELNYTAFINKKILFGLQLFYNDIVNFSSLRSGESDTLRTPNQTIITSPFSFENNEQSAYQLGVNFDLKYSPNNKFSFALAYQFQNTQIKNISLPDNSSNASSLYNVRGPTPTHILGFNFNYKPINKLNCNLNFYHTSFSSFTTYSEFTYDKTDAHIDDLFVLNSKISYQFYQHLNGFVNIRNFGNSIFSAKEEINQYYFSDPIGMSLWLGLHLNY